MNHFTDGSCYICFSLISQFSIKETKKEDFNKPFSDLSKQSYTKKRTHSNTYISPGASGEFIAGGIKTPLSEKIQR